MDAELRVHRYDPADLDALIDIERGAGEGAWSRAQFLTYIRRPVTFCRTIKTVGKDEELIGFFALERHPKSIYLSNIAIAPAWRRKGVALWAMERIDEIARRRGLFRILLDVQENNLQAQLLYRAAGYKAVSIRHGFYGAQDGYRMRRVLIGSGLVQ